MGDYGTLQCSRVYVHSPQLARTTVNFILPGWRFSSGSITSFQMCCTLWRNSGFAGSKKRAIWAFRALSPYVRRFLLKERSLNSEEIVLRSENLRGNRANEVGGIFEVTFDVWVVAHQNKAERSGTFCTTFLPFNVAFSVCLRAPRIYRYLLHFGEATYPCFCKHG